MQGDLNFSTPYTNRNVHLTQNNGSSLMNNGRGNSAPKELLHNTAEMPSYYNNQMPENVQLLNNTFQGMSIS